MINPINKFNLLKNKLNVGEVVNSKIVKKIAPNKAVANIKGYDVIVKSNSHLIENSNFSFFVSGFNEKDKFILLKYINKNNLRNNLINNTIKLNNYITNFLKKNHLPVNHSTIEIAHYLYLKDFIINKNKLQFILKNLKFFNDISLLYKFYMLQANNQNMLNILNFFHLFLKKKAETFRKEKNKSTDNDISLLKDFKFSDNKEENIKKLKLLFNNKKLVHDLIQFNKNDNLPLLIYPLLINSSNECSYLLFFVYNKKYYPFKFNINFNDELIQFKLNFLFEEIKINYHFIYYFKEFKSMIIIDTNNNNLKAIMGKNLKILNEKLNKILKGKVDIFIKGNSLDFKNIDNLDIYV